MDINTLNGCQLLELYGYPVLLSLQGKDPPICGNLYSIDPESRFVVLVQFEGNIFFKCLLLMFCFSRQNTLKSYSCAW